MLAKPPASAGRDLLKPDYIVDKVSDVNFGVLQARGIKAVFIDLDGTVVHQASYEVDKKLSDHLKKQSVDIYIATNRRKSRDLKNLRQLLHADGVIHPSGIFMKPMPQYFRQALKDHQLQASEVAMIGDRYFQDIFGANQTGLTTIVVRKLGIPKGYIDLKFTQLEKKYTDMLAAKYISV